MSAHSETAHSRAALLPSPGDPFLLTFWLDMAKERWLSEVDHLYILVNSNQGVHTFDYLSKYCLKFDNITVIFKGSQIEHGDAINYLLDICTEELVMLIEDDGFIFKPGLVDACFEQIENGVSDLIGSKRGSASSWIINQANQKWNLIDDGLGDQGPNFWPNFLFCKTADLRRTDHNFAAKTWQPGERVDIFDAATPSICVGDTFVWASLQLRNLGLRINYVNQYHASPEDIEHAQRGKFLFDGLCGWIHVGSLSSGFGGLLSDKDLPDIVNTEMERQEIERRVTFWQWFLEYYLSKGQDIPAMTELAIQYRGWLNRLITGYGLQPKRILKRQMLYRELMQWI